MKNFNREAIQRMFDGRKGGGGGGTNNADLAGYATQMWVNQNYVSIEFFNRLFSVHGHDPEDESTPPTDISVLPNDMDSIVDSIESMVGFYTEEYLSALGLNPDTGTGNATTLYELLDVKPNSDVSPSRVYGLEGTSADNGKVLTYSTTYGKWIAAANGAGSGSVTSIDMTVPTGFSVSGAPITTYGTLAITFGGSIAKNKVLASPANATGSPDWRTLVASDIPDLSATYASASDVTTLQGYFDNLGNANSANKLAVYSKTAWGQTYWTSGGVPDNISGDMSSVGDITASSNGTKDIKGFRCLEMYGAASSNFGGYIDFHYNNDSGDYTSRIIEDASGVLKINNTIWATLSGDVGVGTSTTYTKLTVNGGVKTTKLYLYKPNTANDTNAVYFEYDSANAGVHLVGAGFYGNSYISALGLNSQGGGGSITLNEPLNGINNAGLSAPTSSASGQTVVWNGSAWTYSINTTLRAGAIATTGGASIYGNVESTSGNFIASAGHGFMVTGKDDSYVLLAGNGTKPLTEFLLKGVSNTATTGWVANFQTENSAIWLANAAGHLTLFDTKKINSGSEIFNVRYGVTSLGSGNSGYRALSISDYGNVGIGGWPSTSYRLNVNGSVYGDSFIKNGGTSSQFLKADGSVDSNTYVIASSYEYHRSLTYYGGTTVSLLIGEFRCNDSNITISITATTSITRHGTLVVATQNVNTSHGGSVVANVYGDNENVLTPNLRLRYVSGSDYVGVYLILNNYQKLVVDIKTSGVRGVSNICQDVSSIPSDATITATNVSSQSTVWVENADKLDGYHASAFILKEGSDGVLVPSLNADMLDGYHASSFLQNNQDYDLIAHGNEFTFISSSIDTSSIAINWRGKGGYGGRVDNYSFYNGNKTFASVTASYFTTATSSLCTNLNADLLDGQHGSYYATASDLTTSNTNISTLQGYFTNGVATTASKLDTGNNTYKAWGRTYWSSGVPSSVSGNIENAENITPSEKDTYSIGSSSLTFQNGYINKLNFGTAYITKGNYLTFGNISNECLVGADYAALYINYRAVPSGKTTVTEWRWFAGSSSAMASHYMGALTCSSISGCASIDSLLYFDTTNSRIGVGVSAPDYGIDAIGGMRLRNSTSGTGSFNCGVFSYSNNPYIRMTDLNGSSVDIKIATVTSQGNTTYPLSIGDIYRQTRIIGQNVRIYSRVDASSTQQTPAIITTYGGRVIIGSDTTLHTNNADCRMSVSGSLCTAEDDGTFIKIGQIYIGYDSSNTALKVYKKDSNNNIIAANFYATGAVSALGANTSSGGAGDYIPLSGSTAITGSLVPATINTYDLGSSTKAWGTIYCNAISGNASLSVQNVSCTTFSTSARAVISSGAKFYSIYIESDSSGNVSSSHSGEINRDSADVHLQYASGTGGVTMCRQGFRFTTSTDGGGNNLSTISTSNRSLRIELGTATLNPYISKPWNEGSDIRRKDIIANVSASIESIADAPIFNFRYKGDLAECVNLGTSAQYWRNVFPCGVTEMGDGYLAMSYGSIALAAAVVTARKVQNHEDRIRELEERLSLSEAENKALREEIELLKAA